MNGNIIAANNRLSHMQRCYARNTATGSIGRICGIMLLATQMLGGCHQPDTHPSSRTITDRQNRNGSSAQLMTTPSSRDEDRSTHNLSTPMASIGDRIIATDRVIPMLVRGHGPGLLEQLIVLEGAEKIARDRGMTISQELVDTEMDRFLRDLSGQTAWSQGIEEPDFDRSQAMQLLQDFMAERNISLEEMNITMRRHALLRALAESEVEVQPADIRNEFDRRYGERVRIRHIQLASTGAAGRALSDLQQGMSFEQVATNHSVNRSTAQTGGMLDPFSASDDRVPAAIRDIAFSLSQGERSGIIRVGNLFHIIMLVERIPASSEATLDAQRAELEQAARRRMGEARMPSLYRDLFYNTRVVIHDPVLKNAFRERYPDHPATRY